MNWYYICDADFTNIRQATVLEWSEFFNNKNRIVDRTELPHGAVSTVFLGLDHRFSSKGDPVVFETMIFAEGLDCDQWQARATNVTDARGLHLQALTALRAAVPASDQTKH